MIILQNWLITKSFHCLLLVPLLLYHLRNIILSMPLVAKAAAVEQSYNELALNFKILWFKTRRKISCLLLNSDSGEMTPVGGRYGSRSALNPLDHWVLPKSGKSHIGSHALISMNSSFLTLCWHHVFCIYNIYIYIYVLFPNSLFNHTSLICLVPGFKPALTDFFVHIVIWYIVIIKKIN